MRNAKPRKFYLSDEAIDLLYKESVRTTYPMSYIVDMLIKKEFGIFKKQIKPRPLAPAPAPVVAATPPPKSKPTGDVVDFSLDL